MLGPLTPTQMRAIAFEFLGNLRLKGEVQSDKAFHKHFGSKPADVAAIWNDLISTDVQTAKLCDKENSARGAKFFLMAHNFLWTYPKNREVLASRFGVCEKYAGGQNLWEWIKKIQALKAEKIVWFDELNSQQGPIFCITVDGVDCRMNDPEKHVDKGYYSHKFNHCAAKYELGISIFHSKLVWINGPFRGGRHDISIFREEGLRDKIQPGKMVIADGGYRCLKYPQEADMIAIPDSMDSEELYNFKIRARQRHESFNGRIKNFRCLSDTFHHTFEKHKVAFEAVCVIVQYQMDNGAKLFAV